VSSAGADAASSAESDRPDLLRLHGLRFFGHHGVSAAERRAGGEFIVDLDVEADLSRALVTDDVADTVNYVELYAVIREIVELREYHLLEVMASEIAADLLRLPHVRRVRLRVAKPPRLPAQDKGFAVEIVRPS